MATADIRLIPAVLTAVLALGGAGCAVRPTAEHRPIPETWRAAVADTIRTLIARSQEAYESNDCDVAGAVAWLPDQAPLVHFSAEDAFHDRRHFLALAARAMRQITVDHARRTRTTKRGGALVRVPLNSSHGASGPAAPDARRALAHLRRAVATDSLALRGDVAACALPRRPTCGPRRCGFS
jgi:hypothetical protein